MTKYDVDETRFIVAITIKLVDDYNKTANFAKDNDLDIDEIENRGVPVAWVNSQLENAEIVDEDFMENEYENLIPEGYELNFNGSNYWFS